MDKILCIGKTTVDMIFAELEVFPQIGKEYASKDFLIKPGGCANSPIAMAKLGLPTVFVSSLGKDFLGEQILENMKEIGLDTAGIYRGDNVKTNVTGVLSVGFDRGFASYFPTWRTEEVNQLYHEYLKECSHVHLSLKDCLEGDWIEAAKAQGCTVSIDATWDERLTLDAVKEYLKQCDIFFCNNLEANLITGTTNIDDAVKILKEVCDNFVLKLGAEGSVLYKSGMCLTVPAPYIEKVYDTTGAGDAFVAGFLYGYFNNYPLEECLKFGSASGSLATTFYGGTDVQYTLENVIKLKESIDITQLC